MTVVKMPPVNVGPCVTAFTQVSADQWISARHAKIGYLDIADGEGGGGGDQKCHFADILFV